MVPRTNPGLIGFTLPASGLSMPFKKDQSSPFYAHAQEKCKLLENRSTECPGQSRAFVLLQPHLSIFMFSLYEHDKRWLKVSI